MQAPAHFDSGSSVVGVDRPGAAAVPVCVVQRECVVVTAKRQSPATAVAQTGADEVSAPRVR